jgi:hypothetical protein
MRKPDMPNLSLSVRIAMGVIETLPRNPQEVVAARRLLTVPLLARMELALHCWLG